MKGKVTYASSNEKIASVNGSGKVKVKKMGVATITIKAATKNCKERKLKVTVIIGPAKQKVKSVKADMGKKLSVSWTEDGNATGYKVQCSTDKNFRKNVKNIKINNNKTASAVFHKLKKGQKYYVRVCAYRKEKGKLLCGEWSKAVRSKKIK